MVINLPLAINKKALDMAIPQCFDENETTIPSINEDIDIVNDKMNHSLVKLGTDLKD